MLCSSRSLHVPLLIHFLCKCIFFISGSLENWSSHQPNLRWDQTDIRPHQPKTENDRSPWHDLLEAQIQVLSGALKRHIGLSFRSFSARLYWVYWPGYIGFIGHLAGYIGVKVPNERPVSLFKHQRVLHKRKLWDNWDNNMTKFYLLLILITVTLSSIAPRCHPP